MLAFFHAFGIAKMVPRQQRKEVETVGKNEKLNYQTCQSSRNPDNDKPENSREVPTRRVGAGLSVGCNNAADGRCAISGNTDAVDVNAEYPKCLSMCLFVGTLKF